MSKIMKGGVEYAFGSSSIESGSSMEVVTREEYDTLVANGTVKTGVYYFITEDNGTPEWVYDESTGKITGYKTKIGGADTVFPFKSGSISVEYFPINNNENYFYNNKTYKHATLLFGKRITVADDLRANVYLDDVLLGSYSQTSSAVDIDISNIDVIKITGNQVAVTITVE